MSRFNGGGMPVVVWDGHYCRPGIGVTLAEEWHCATILVRNGKAALQAYVKTTAEIPGQGFPEGRELATETAWRVQECRDDLAEGWDPAELERDPDRYDETDRLIVGWLTGGEMPGFREMCLELAWSYFLDRIVEYAAEHIAGAEVQAEDEEVASYRVRRWLEAVNPFAGHDWLPRAAMQASYVNWCRVDGAGDKAGHARDFYMALKELGCQEAGRNGVRGFRPPKA